jgi:hypothetical protein
VDLLGERLAERRIGAHIVRIRSSSNGASKDDMNQSKNDRVRGFPCALWVCPASGHAAC